MPRQWSPLQTAIFDFTATRDASYSVQGVPGCGKTTTQVESMTHLPSTMQGHTIALCFGKRDQLTLEERVPFGVEAKTFHSFGLRAIRRLNPRSEKNGRKVPNLLRRRLPSLYHDSIQDLASVFSWAKSQAIGLPSYEPNTPDTWRALLLDSDLALPNHQVDRLSGLLPKLYAESIANIDEWDFDDHLISPLWLDLPLPRYPIIYIDEAQDLSPVQHAIITRILEPGGRLMAYGDPHQAIYGFRGALSNSLAALEDSHAAVRLPLTVSYRCPTSIVQAARRFEPAMDWAPGAPEGEVLTLPTLPPLPSLTPDHYIICRNNAPIMRLAYRFLRQQLPVTVLGNFGEALKRFIKSFKTDDTTILLDRLDAWYATEAAALADDERRLAVLTDKYESVQALAQNTTEVSQILDRLDTLFTPKSGPILSTIHKAKGREAPHVIIYSSNLIPSKWAHSPEELAQEDNLLYVAITRALQTLTYIPYE
jgi:superfamily I DNA/RNA helicase